MTPGKKQAFEPTGLIPRSIVRTFERFYKQLLPKTKYSAIREYRISRYQVLVSIRCLCTLLILPLVTRVITNWLIFSYALPQIKYFWDVTYQDEHVFSEIDQFSQVLFFDSLLDAAPSHVIYPSPYSSGCSHVPNTKDLQSELPPFTSCSYTKDKSVALETVNKSLSPKGILASLSKGKEVLPSFFCSPSAVHPVAFGYVPLSYLRSPMHFLYPYAPSVHEVILASLSLHQRCIGLPYTEGRAKESKEIKDEITPFLPTVSFGKPSLDHPVSRIPFAFGDHPFRLWRSPRTPSEYRGTGYSLGDAPYLRYKVHISKGGKGYRAIGVKEHRSIEAQLSVSNQKQIESDSCIKNTQDLQSYGNKTKYINDEINRKETRNTQDQALQNKIFELAESSHFHALQSVTNVFADLSSILVLIFLLITLKPEITILKSFLVEVIYNLSDTTKSFLLILMTDLLVGFHSPRGWETLFSLILHHFGLPENQDFVFLFVATLPVILDTVFKYWIFRHLNKISPSTVATYHNMIE